VRVDESDKLSYCHFDSYPSGLGLQVLSAARVIADNMETFRQRARDMRVVVEKEVATHEDIAHYSEWADTSVSSGEISDWYVLLRKMQGKLLDNLASLIMLDAADFILDSLFCEFGYIVNFDTCKLEFYAGQAVRPHDNGRYGQVSPGGCPWRDHKYYGVPLVHEFDLQALPTDDEFLRTVGS